MARKKVWECVICSYQYDEAREGVPFSELPDDWECPDCGAPRAPLPFVTTGLLEEWYLCGPAPVSEAPALEQRFQRARAALEAGGLEHTAA